MKLQEPPENTASQISMKLKSWNKGNDFQVGNEQPERVRKRHIDHNGWQTGPCPCQSDPQLAQCNSNEGVQGSAFYFIHIEVSCNGRYWWKRSILSVLGIFLCKFWDACACMGKPFQDETMISFKVKDFPLLWLFKHSMAFILYPLVGSHLSVPYVLLFLSSEYMWYGISLCIGSPCILPYPPLGW